jgi:hypothetical protein
MGQWVGRHQFLVTKNKYLVNLNLSLFDILCVMYITCVIIRYDIPCVYIQYVCYYQV